MVIDLLQAGIRTAYRTLGARELSVETDRATLHGFSFEGANPDTIVLLHGLGDASTTWFQTIRPLRDRHDLLALDLPPFGLSSLKSLDHLAPSLLADEVATVLEDRLDGPVHVVGQSMGGWVAAHLLARHPDLVDRAVLISPGGCPLPGSLGSLDLMTPETNEDVLAFWQAMWYDPPALAKAVAGADLRRFKRPGFRRLIEAVKPENLPDPADGRPMTELIGEPPAALTDGELAALADVDLLVPDTLARIETPGLVIWGKEDRLLDGQTPAYLARHWGGPLDRTYLARCAHVPHLERPKAVLARMTSFLG